MNTKKLKFENTIQYDHDIWGEGFMQIVVQAVQGMHRAIDSLNIAPLDNFSLPITLAKKNDQGPLALNILS